MPSAPSSSAASRAATTARITLNDELAGLKALQRRYMLKGIKSPYVFVNERGHPFGRMGIGRMIERAGEAAKLPFPVHVHMLDRLRSGRQGHGYSTPATLPWPRQHH